MRWFVGLCFILIPSGLALAEETVTQYHYSGNITFDIAKVPFSRYGSYLAFSKLSGERAPDAHSGVYLRNMHGGAGAEHPVFRVELLAGDSPVPFEVTASPARLHLEAAAGSVDVCFSETDQVRFRGQGVSLRFVPSVTAIVVPNANSHWEIHDTYQSTEKYMLWPIDGNLRVSGSWTGTQNEHVSATFVPDPASHWLEGEIDTYDSVWTFHTVGADFAASVQNVERDYRKWLERMPEVPSEFGAGAELAAYANWASVVEPMGFLDRPAMLMSKNWMANVWSWDHCFNAMALSFRDPDLAWQQFMVLFDNQETHGALPDEIRDSFKAYNYSKPPIHGWALQWMMEHGGYGDVKHLAEAYEPISRWTEWYFRYRDSNGDGLPEYNHGNDSGWDNSTVMLSGIPVETPDLDSFLILQMDTLSIMARKLGKEQDAQQWQSRSDELMKKMLATLWKEDHFVAIRADNGQQVESESLLLYMPLILGNKIPTALQQKLVEGLTRQGRFRTSYGFSSEALTSKYYAPDGYWLGPIWAPTTMLLAEGLDSVGQRRLAHDLRVDFCRMAQQSGMSENFDAKTGAPLRDPAYTWTSSVYLIFAHQLWKEDKGAMRSAP
jgi:putative isomerase